MTGSKEAVFVIRQAKRTDADRIAELSDDLGYPVSPSRIAERIERYARLERDLVLVAQTHDGDVVGWIHGSVLDLLETGRRGEILGLVVDTRFRGRGIGSTLVAKVEKWAREAGLPMISVRSNVLRQESHPFYEKLGYTRSKTQHVYRKQLKIESPGS